MVVAARTFFEGVNAKMRSWGYNVEEQSGCWSRGNGSSWTHGGPVAATNHHFVISLGSPIANGVQNVTYGDAALSGPKCNYYGGVDPVTGKKRVVFISVGPANHAGQGRSEVRDRMAANQAPLGWVAESYSSAADNWSGGNTSYMGTELHHPGDATPWPAALLELIVDLNAAAAIVGGWPAARSHMHAEHSARKIDMSWLRGQGGHELRRRVAARIGGGGGGTPPPVTPNPPTTTDEDAWLTVGAREDILNAISYAADKTMAGKGGEPPNHNIAQVKDLLQQVRQDIAGLRKALFQPGFDVEDGSHSSRAEVGWATDRVIGPKLDEVLRVLGQAPAPPAGPATYTVVSGDTLSGIATKTGKSVADLQAWNKITDPNTISVGQVLRLGP